MRKQWKHERLYFPGLQNQRLNSGNLKCLFLGRKTMTNLDRVLKGRGITLLTKVPIIKAIVFPVVTYGCERWTIKKAEHCRIDAFDPWCWRRLLKDQTFYSPWNSPDQNTGVGSLSLLQGIFPTQGSNPGFLHCRQIRYHLSHQGSSSELR